MKKTYHKAKAAVVDWDARMKRYQFYKTMVKEALLMIGWAGTTIGTLVKTFLPDSLDQVAAVAPDPPEVLLNTRAPEKRSKAKGDPTEGLGGVSGDISPDLQTMSGVHQEQVQYSPMVQESSYPWWSYTIYYTPHFLWYLTIAYVAYRVLKWVRNKLLRRER